MTELQDATPGVRERHRFLIAGALLVALIAAAYLPAILHGGFVWDDDEYLTNNVTLAAPDALRRIWLEPRSSPQYYPLVFTVFLAERRMWGLDPRGFHAVNVALHAANALLVWRLALLLGIPGAWLVAAIFGLHPVHVESVAWVTERKNVLSGFFYLGAMLAYLRFEPPQGRPVGTPGRWRRYALSLLLFTGALLSKTVTSSLPAAILLLLWWKRGRIGWRDVLPLLPFVALGLAAGAHTAALEKFRVGTHGPEWAIAALDRVLIAGRALWFYAGKIIWPHPLLFTYPRWQLTGAAWWYLFPAGVASVLLLLWFFRRPLGRGPLVAVLFTAGTLAPALGFINFFPMRYSFVADHFQYLASLGTIALAVGGAATVLPRRLSAHRLARPAGAVLLVILGALTWRQGDVYRNAETVWLDVLAKDPDSPLANANHGNTLLEAGDLAAARMHLERAISRKPDFYQARLNLGLTLGKQGDLEGAKRSFERALRDYPSFSEAYENLGVAHAMAGETEEARRALERAVELKPDNLNALLNLATLHERQGDLTLARQVYRTALAVKPFAPGIPDRLAAVEARLAGRGVQGR